MVYYYCHSLSTLNNLDKLWSLRFLFLCFRSRGLLSIKYSLIFGGNDNVKHFQNNGRAAWRCR